ncbi:MAG: 6-phosphofructokinase [Ruminococcus sp.]|nr:6-phosphofructokinase [Ruminococcus sp.]
MSRTIGILTSGGDAPGMNAAIRAVVRASIAKGFKAVGIRRGYQGLIEGDMYEMNVRDVSDIVQRGGTILFTARSKKFMTEEGLDIAKANCDKFGIDSLVCIGGGGTFRGALDISKKGVKCIGIPGTIDNDIACTDYTIGFDTALNTALGMIDKIKDTEMSHSRCSVVEVMGRRAGHIAVNVGVATGATEVITVEKEFNLAETCAKMLEQKKTGKRHFEIVVAEGVGHSEDIGAYIQEHTGIETRVTVLGHVQRGGAPTCTDRVMAARMGCYAVDLLANGLTNRVVALKNGHLVDYDIVEALGMRKSYDEHLHMLLSDLSL